MSQPTPPNTGPANQPPPAPGPTDQTPPHQTPADQTPAPSSPTGTGERKTKGSSDDPLRGSFTSHTWVAVIALLVVLVLLAVFVLQNTQSVEISYFGWTGQAPLAAALLIASAAGLLIAGVAGTLRIWQLRRRVRKYGG